jgi:hypothetical protein
MPIVGQQVHAGYLFAEALAGGCPPINAAAAGGKSALSQDAPGHRLPPYPYKPLKNMASPTGFEPVLPP